MGLILSFFSSTFFCGNTPPPTHTYTHPSFFRPKFSTFLPLPPPDKKRNFSRTLRAATILGQRHYPVGVYNNNRPRRTDNGINTEGLAPRGMYLDAGPFRGFIPHTSAKRGRDTAGLPSPRPPSPGSVSIDAAVHQKKKSIHLLPRHDKFINYFHDRVTGMRPTHTIST